MKHILSLCLVNTMILMVGCSTQTPDKPVSKTESETKITPEMSKQTEAVEVKVKEILKPGELQVEVPEDIVLPESAIVVTGGNIGSSGKTHYYIQIPDIETAQGVADYFAAELPKHGWEILNGKGEERVLNAISLDFKKENRRGTVVSYVKPNLAGATVQMKIQETQK